MVRNRDKLRSMAVTVSGEPIMITVTNCSCSDQVVMEERLCSQKPLSKCEKTVNGLLHPYIIRFAMSLVMHYRNVWGVPIQTIQTKYKKLKKSRKPFKIA